MTRQITGAMFKSMIISGAAAIEGHKSEINELNVFPVPDGDTGTNMSLTMGAGAAALSGASPDSIGRAADITAGALLRGARGNSGVILSLLFRGIARHLKDMETADAFDFACAVSSGVDSAYKAVMKPAEGTILTVSRLAAGAAFTEAEHENDIETVLECAMKAGREALANTINLNPVLKKAGVVDAGGKGYLYILEGMLSALRGEAQQPSPETAGLEPPPAPVPKAEIKERADFTEFETKDIRFAYCTEFIVGRKTNKDPDLLRAFLDARGDSLVVVEDDEVIKVHVHSNEPGAVLTEALTYGPLLTVKVENMHEQHSSKLVENGPAGSTEETEAAAAPPFRAPAQPAEPAGQVPDQIPEADAEEAREPADEAAAWQGGVQESEPMGEQTPEPIPEKTREQAPEQFPEYVPMRIGGTFSGYSPEPAEETPPREPDEAANEGNPAADEPASDAPDPASAPEAEPDVLSEPEPEVKNAPAGFAPIEPEHAEEPAAETPQKEFGVVAVCAGEGMANIFRDLGADNIIYGGQTMNPSTEDILTKIDATPAQTVFVLPNNRNIIMAAQQCMRLTEKKVIVIPTKTMPQGISALIALDAGATVTENARLMSDAMARVHTAQITYAARDSAFDGQSIRAGDYIALMEDALVATGKDSAALVDAIAFSLAQYAPEFITIFYGEDVEQKTADEVYKRLTAAIPEAETTIVFGGQPVYYFIISAE